MIISFNFILGTLLFARESRLLPQTCLSCLFFCISMQVNFAVTTYMTRQMFEMCPSV